MQITIGKLERFPRGHWKNQQHQVEYFDWLGGKLGYKSMEDWYNVKQEHIITNGGRGLLDLYYNNSPSRALQQIYPQHKWQLEKFKGKPVELKSDYKTIRNVFLATKDLQVLPHGFWKDRQHHIEFFDWLGGKLGYKSMEDWYNVTADAVVKNGGGSLLGEYYNHSPSKALESVYKEHKWQLWRFKKILGYWKNVMKDGKQVGEIIEWLGEKLGIKQLDEWYNISLTRVNELVHIGPSEKLGEMLKNAYPEHGWNVKLLGHKGFKRVTQHKVIHAMKHLFPNHSMYLFKSLETIAGVEEEYKHPRLKHSSNQLMELDGYIEALHLAVEYHGEQHFFPMYWSSGNFEQQLKRDEEKRDACIEHNITLIEVPYWWDGTIESLAATIHQLRSDLLVAPPNGVPPIPSSPQHERTVEQPLSHGQWWNGNQNVSGWWMSEKMDGVRGYWNGKELLSRYGKKIACPSWFTEWFVSTLPQGMTLDGELWMGRIFSHVNVTTILNSKKGDWNAIGYYIFDIPSDPGTYEDRMKLMETLKPNLPSHVHIVENVQCGGVEHLRKYLSSIVTANGEGVMLRQRSKENTPGYTTSILKVKQSEDTEVTVLAKYLRANGLECVVRDCKSNIPLSMGSVITIKFNGVSSSGILMDPTYWRMKESSQQNQRVLDWSNPSNHKEFFDSLARSLNVKQSADWYKVKMDDVYAQGGRYLLKHFYSDSLYNALTAHYPNIRLPWMFDGEVVPSGFWQNQGHHTEFFDWLYKELGYTSMEDWYNVTQKDITSNGGGGLLHKYNNSPTRALQSVYPQHNWELEKFKLAKPRGFWEDQLHQLEFFDELFNTLGYKSMEDWYSVTRQDIFNNEGGALLMQYYNSSPSRALQSVYPQHKWELGKFSVTPRRFWNNQQHQIEFFDKLFNKLGHKCMEDWYNVTVGDIMKDGGATLLQKYYNNSPSRALRTVYPQHQWELEKFKQKPKHLQTDHRTERNVFLATKDLQALPHGFWNDQQHRVEFFDWLFSKLEYQTMENWYNVTQEDIIKNGGATLLYKYYNGSPSGALQSIYSQHRWELSKFKCKPRLQQINSLTTK